MNFSGSDTLAGITNGTSSMAAGTWTATDLNNFFGGTNFVGTTATFTVVPEPDAAVMLLGSAGMLFAFRRSRQRA